MKNQIIWLVIIVLLTISCENINEADFKEAKELNKLDKYEESNRILKTLVEKKYKLDSVYYFLGNNNFGIGLNNGKIEEDSDSYYSSAINYLTKAIKENPNYFKAYELRIKAWHNKGDYKNELKEINEAMIHFKDSTSLILLRGLAKHGLDDYNGSDIDINKFLENESIDTLNMIESYRWLGRNHYYRKEFVEAIEDYTKAINLDTVNTFYEYYIERGNAYKAIRDNENACKDFRMATDLGYLGLVDEIKNYCN